MLIVLQGVGSTARAAVVTQVQADKDTLALTPQRYWDAPTSSRKKRTPTCVLASSMDRYMKRASFSSWSFSLRACADAAAALLVLDRCRPDLLAGVSSAADMSGPPERLQPREF